MNLTREQAILEHRKMWNWIADELEKGNCVEKIDYLISHGYNPSEIKNRCFLCTFCLEHCDCCPLQWSETWCEYEYSEYAEYCESETLDEKSYWARKIANLPERG